MLDLSRFSGLFAYSITTFYPSNIVIKIQKNAKMISKNCLHLGRQFFITLILTWIKIIYEYFLRVAWNNTIFIWFSPISKKFLSKEENICLLYTSIPEQVSPAGGSDIQPLLLRRAVFRGKLQIKKLPAIADSLLYIYNLVDNCENKREKDKHDCNPLCGPCKAGISGFVLVSRKECIGRAAHYACLLYTSRCV